MPRKASRRIYDPTLSVEQHDDDATNGNLGVGYFHDNDDPLASPFHDQEKQVVSEIVDAKLHQLPLPQHIRRKRRRLLTLLLCALTVAIIVGTSIGIHNKKQRDKDSTTSSSSFALLPPAPSNLASVCNIDQVSNDPNAKLACRQVCQPADCCDYPADLDLSCLDGNQDLCLEYHRYCNVLDDGGQDTTTTAQVPPAPGNIQQLCDSDTLARQGVTGVQACASICLPVQCCYETQLDVPSCRTQPNCASYAACLNLAAHDNVASSIQSEVEQKCASPNTLGACMNVCAVARCCFMGDFTCDDKADDDLFCNQYQACSSIPGWGPNDHDDGDPTFSPTIMFTFEPTAEPTPLNVNTPSATSMTFEPTMTLMPTLDNFGGINNILPPLPANLSTICSNMADDDSVNDDAYFACDSLCMAAECCDLPETFPQSCLASQTDLCMEYAQACAPLDANTTHVTVELNIQNSDLTDNTLGDVCSAESISYIFGLRECRKRCQPAKCCWKRNGPRCQDEHCKLYAPCLNLIAMNTANDAIIETVQTACRTSMLKSDQGRAVCENVCLQHKCCFDDTCLMEDASICDAYDGCAVLFAAGNNFTNAQAGHVVLKRPTNLQDLCDENFMDSQSFYNDCAAACSAADCCNYPANMDISCLAGNEGVCFAYHKQCATLRTRGVAPTNAVTVDAAPDNLSEICEPTSLSTIYGLSQCKNYCYAASCCWMDNIKAENMCVDNANCPGYAPCLNLRAASTNSTNIVEEVTSKCTITQVLSTEGKAECENVCRQHSCCWQLNEESCFRDADCRQYDGCQLLVDVDNNGIPDSEQVDNPATVPPQDASPGETLVSSEPASSPTVGTLAPSSATASATIAPTTAAPV